MVKLPEHKIEMITKEVVEAAAFFVITTELMLTQEHIQRFKIYFEGIADKINTELPPVVAFDQGGSLNALTDADLLKAGLVRKVELTKAHWFIRAFLDQWDDDATVDTKLIAAARAELDEEAQPDPRDAQIVTLEARVKELENFIAKPPKHKFWGAGEKDCPSALKAGNGELHTLKCKVCGAKNPLDNICRAAGQMPAERAT